jgi:ribosomal protein L20A (L18A)
LKNNGKEDVAAKEKQKLEKYYMAILLNPALEKLAKHGGSTEKLTKNEIQAILFV